MKHAVIAAAGVALLAACNQNGAAANNPAAVEPATGNLTIGSDPARADQAIDRTDNQSGAANTVEATANQVAQ